MQKKFSKRQIIGFTIGLCGAILLYILPIEPDNLAASRTAAVVFLMATLWLTEAIPLAVTSLLPLVLLPLLGISDALHVSAAYMNNIIFLFIGAFLISISVEKWELHRRIAISIIKLIGGGPPRILFALMFSSWLLSMFINNTSTTMLMLPIAVSIILKLEEVNGKLAVAGFSVAVLLGVAYASSIGGIATLVGTVPNMVFARIFSSTFPLGPEISFSSWFIAIMPISALLLIVVWIFLKFILIKKGDLIKLNKDYINLESKKLESMSYEEKIITLLLFSVALLWIFRRDLNLGFIIVPGWSNVLAFGNKIDDSTIAILIALLMFIIPSKSKPGEFIADSEALSKVPWDVIILFGGGFAIADAFKNTELALIISRSLNGFESISPFLMVIAVCFLLTFLTELTSNTATTQTLLPILAATSTAMGINPLLLMMPATISASMAFMMPVATPPNAIIFGTGRIKIAQMAKIGFFINLIGVVIISLMFYFLSMFVLNINPNELPFWSK